MAKLIFHLAGMKETNNKTKVARELDNTIINQMFLGGMISQQPRFNNLLQNLPSLNHQLIKYPTKHQKNKKKMLDIEYFLE